MIVTSRFNAKRARFGFLGFFAWALCAQASATEIGLRPHPLVGPVAQLYHQPLEYGDITRPGQPLLRWRWKRPMVESAMSFAMKEVTVDSNGVHYTPVTAGFPSGPR